jgi:hypothetical protein
VIEVAAVLACDPATLRPQTRLSSLDSMPFGAAHALLLGLLEVESGRSVPHDLYASIETLGELYDWLEALH